MCGLAGWFGSLPFDGSHAAALAGCLRHRGPDAEGIRVWPDATLVHRRLSIIDLTPTGEQPLDNEDGTVWTVFNGEIYNHHALRAEAEGRGHRFRGRADSEVLPHLYEEWQSAFLPRLRGMFAFAIYDSARRRLLLARDRFGIKPLFYAPLPHGIVFASELRALLALPEIDRTVDRQALYDYTALTFVPAPATFYRGIRALEPGCFIEAEGLEGQFRYRVGRYHSWSIHPRIGWTMPEAVDEADVRIRQAVRSQLESDVPIGSLLSGGIDSSLVSVAAQEALAPDTLRTFNVRFPDARYDETWAARMVADAVGSAHETLDFDSGGGSWQSITDLLRHAGQPFADTSMFAVNAVSRLMRKRVTVALSGDGGDEAFGGYDLYTQLETLARLRRLPRTVLEGGALALRVAGLVNRKYSRWSGRVTDFTRDDATFLSGLFRWVRDRELSELMPDLDVEPVERLFESSWTCELPPGASDIERLSAHATEVNTRLVLPNDYLFKVDVASMRESLEVRVPMLDEDLFELGLSLPHRLKVEKGRGKAVLRALARRKLPRRVAEKPKWGFGVPLDTWVDRDFRERLRDTITRHSPISRYYDPAAYLPLIETFCRQESGEGTVSRTGLYQRVILLLSLNLTLESIAVPVTPLAAPVAVRP